MSIAAVFTLNLTLAVIFPACDSRWMRNSDSTQQAVFRPMQLPLCPVWRRVWRTESWDRSLPPAGPLLPLCTIKSSDCYCASALWSRRPGEASDGGGRVQVWDRPWRKERHGCRFQARVTLMTFCAVWMQSCVANHIEIQVGDKFLIWIKSQPKWATIFHKR